MNKVPLSDGRSMSYLHHVCEKEDAATIVFVHGFPLDHSMWRGQLPLLDHASLLMPDLPGFGKSDPVAGDMTMRGLADDVANLLKELDISKAVFCGLSMGGYIGWEFVINHREMLDGLICCNTRAAADDELTARARHVAAQQVLKDGTDPVAAAMREKLFSKESLRSQNELVNGMTDIIRQASPAAVAAAQRAMAVRSDHSGNLPSIDVPTLVVAGADDVITPADDMREMSLLIGEASFVEIAEAGHLSPSEKPEVFNSAVTHWLV